MEMKERLEKYQRVYAEVDLDAIAANLMEMRSRLEPRTKMLAVVKADAYGHGSVPVAGKLEPFDFVFGFAVATAEEAFALRRGGIRKPVLVLGYTFPGDYERLIEEDIRMAVFRPDTIEELKLAARKAGKSAKVHIKVDTGMNRIGITPDRAGLGFVELLAHQREIETEGVFTHFARADEADKANAEGQLETFRGFLHMIEEELSLEIPVKHCANSAGILEMPEAQMDMVRAGISMYGQYPSDEVRRDIRLTPALSLYSHIVFVKTVRKGQSVSYGGTYTAQRDMRVATVPVGYGDGYPRGLSNRGFCLLHGKRVPILGRICMDQFMVDVSAVPEAAEGDRIVLLGRDGEESVGAEQLAELSGRFHYELLCCFGKRIPRIYREGEKIFLPESFE